MDRPGDGSATLSEIVTRIARARQAGTPAETAVRRELAARLVDQGYDVRFERFAYDPFWVRRGFAWILAAASGLLAVAAATPDPAAPAVLALALALPVVAVAATGTPRVDRRARLVSENVLVSRSGGWTPGRAPGVLLMAHVDSKSQRLSFAARSAAALLAALGAFGGLVALSFGEDGASLARVLFAAGALATAGVAAAGSGNASPGALDNATGVAAVVELMRRFAERPVPLMEVGAVLTSAEEDGLVGAHRFAEAHAGELGESLVINIDTLGPSRSLALLVHDRRPDPTSLLARACVAIGDAAGGANLRVVRRRAPFPAGTDSHPLARAGVAALTLASGTIRNTFMHLHRPSDTLERVDPIWLARAVDVVEDAVRALGRER